MSLLGSPNDLALLAMLNKELINNIIDTKIELYIFDAEFSQTNVYNDIQNKLYHKNLELSGLISYQEAEIDFDNMEEETQVLTVAFHKKELVDLGITLKSGDIFKYNNRLYKIQQTVEKQFNFGFYDNSYSVLCYCTLSRKSAEYVEKVESYYSDNTTNGSKEHNIYG